MSVAAQKPDDDRTVLLASTVESALNGEEFLLREQANSFQLLWRVAPLALVSALMHTFMMLEIHVYVPYLYSRVRCCVPGIAQLDSHFDVTDSKIVDQMRSEAAKLDLDFVENDGVVPACAVPNFGRSSAMWSLSPNCPNKAFVQQSAQGIMATMKPLQKLFAFIVLPIGGALADSVGRVPVLVMYSGALVVGCLMLAWDSYSGGLSSNLIVYVAGCFFGFAFQPKDTILSASVADVMNGNEANVGRTLVAMRAVDLVLSIFINTVVYMYLKGHHEKHHIAWLSFAAVAGSMALVLGCCVKESLPEKARSLPSPDMLFPMISHFKSFKIVAKDPVLIIQSVIVFLFYAYFLGYITTRTSYLTLIGWRMEDAMLPEILAPACALLFFLVLMPLLPRVGVWHMSTLGNALFGTGYALVGPFTIFVSFAGPYAASVVFAMAVMITFPAFQTIVSQRAEAENRARVQSAVFAIGTLGTVISVPLYNRVLYDSTATGLHKAICPITSMTLAFLCTLLSIIVTYVARRYPGPPLSVPVATTE